MNENKLIKILAIIIFVIVVLNIFNVVFNKPSWQLDRFINVCEESNFPTWFSSMLLVIAAYFAYKCSITAKTKERGRGMLQLLSLGLLGMSCDEVAMIHENMGEFVNRHFFKIANLKSEWVILLGPIVLFIIIVFVIKMSKYLKDSAKAKKFLVMGAFIYIFGAFILEATLNVICQQEFQFKSLYKIEYILEEFLEMTGVVLIIKGLIEHFRFLSSQRLINE